MDDLDSYSVQKPRILRLTLILLSSIIKGRKEIGIVVF